MPNPSYYQTSPAAVTSLVQQQEHVFHITARQGSSNQRNIVPTATEHFGSAWAIDWELMDDGATVIGRLEGVVVGTATDNWYLSANLVFTDQRFRGSTLNVQGRLGPSKLPDEGEWTVLGGTGELSGAQGNITYKRIQVRSNEAGGCTTQLHIRVVCLTFPKPKPVQKVGPWGGNGGTAYEIDADQLPQRLDSLTVYDDGHVLQSIEFSYTDQAGHNRTVGPWGDDAGNGWSMNPEIMFGASETLKEIYGTTGQQGGRKTVTSLTIVTNVTSYGPYGKQSRGDTPFHVAAPNGQSIVGFYGRADGLGVNQIGAYVV